MHERIDGQTSEAGDKKSWINLDSPGLMQSFQWLVTVIGMDIFYRVATKSLQKSSITRPCKKPKIGVE